MALLLTRPKEDSEPLARELAGYGFDCLVEPLLFVQTQTRTLLDLDGAQGLLVTSANGIRAFADRSERRDLTVYAVGDASAREAEMLGFASIQSASGDVDTLTKLVVDRADPDKGVLVHVAGTKLAGDLGGQLSEAGYTYRRAVLYAARKATGFTTETRAALESGRINGVLLYSPRTAETFAELIRKAHLEGACRHITAFCLSEAVRNKLVGLDWQSVRVADEPTQAALIDNLLEYQKKNRT